MDTFKTKLELFKHIWETRPHVSQISGEPLLPMGNFQWHWQFLHVLGGNYPHYKLNPDNILLGTVEEHEHQDRYTAFKEKQEELKKQYYKTYYGKNF
jgi:hypothetical protein